jgi:hypothetical protein
MQIVEVKNKRQEKSFLDMVDVIYRDDENYVRPLDVMISEVFDRKKNILFKNGDAVRFLLVDDQQRVIGRIAAFVNGNKAYSNDQPTGGIGFFECIDNKDAATMLFDAAKGGWPYQLWRER